MSMQESAGSPYGPPYPTRSSEPSAPPKIKIVDCHDEVGRLLDAVTQVEMVWRTLTGEQEAPGPDQKAEEEMDNIAYLRQRIMTTTARIIRLGTSIAER